MSAILQIAGEPLDRLTYWAICSRLDRLAREHSPRYPDALNLAHSIVMIMPVEACRLPHWPRDRPGQSTAIQSGFWPIIRSLGFEQCDAYDWFPRQFASVLPRSIPPTLAELAVVVDDPAQFRSLLPTSAVQSITLVPGSDADARALLEALPPSVGRLWWHGPIYHVRFPDSMETLQKVGLSLQAFDASVSDFSGFRKCLENAPDSVTEFGPNLFLGDGDRIAVLSTNATFSRHIRRLLLHAPAISDHHAKLLGDAHFPELVSFEVTLSQPSDLPTDVLTSQGAKALAQSSWWPQLERVAVANVYDDAVVAPLMAGLSTRLQSLAVRCDPQTWNPHPKKVGLTDVGLGHIPFDVLASLESLSMENARLTGTMFRDWASRWQNEAGGPRSIELRFIEWLDYEALDALLRSPFMQGVEMLDLSWPDFKTAHAFDISLSLASSPYLGNVRELVLEVWAFDCRRLCKLVDSPLLPNTLNSLVLGFDDRGDDPQELRKAFTEVFHSPLGLGLRQLTVTSLTTADTICQALESLDVSLDRLRSLRIEARECNIVSVGRLARAKCLEHLWCLSLAGSASLSREMFGPSSDAVRRAIGDLGGPIEMGRLLSLELKNVAGFDEHAVRGVLNSQLVSDLLVLPEWQRFASIWQDSRVLCPLARGVVDAFIRQTNES